MRTIAVVNQKGGSGKTTSSISLSAALASRGQRTLLVDLDPQGHCGTGLAIPEERIDLQIGDAMLWPGRSTLPTDRFVWNIRTNLDVIPSNTQLAGLESPRGGLATREDKDQRLAALLGAMGESYDWCVIDCAPYIGLLTFNALRACDEVLIPVEAGFFALEGAGKQVATLHALSRRFGRQIPYRIVPTMYDRNSKVGDDVLEAIRHRFSETLAPVVIRLDEKVREATSMGSPVTEYAPQSAAAKDYAALASYIMEHEPARVSVLMTEEETGGGTAVALGGDGGDGNGAFVPGDLEHNEPPSTSIRTPRATGEMVETAVNVDPKSVAPAREPVAPRSMVSTVSRAAELAAKARQLAMKSEEIGRTIREDPRVARAMARDAVAVPDETASGYTPSPVSDERIGFGATAVGNGVWFIQPGDESAEIGIAGDHNGWVPSATKLRYNAGRGVHEVFIVASAGPMRYRLVVNGAWIADPYNPNTQANPYGGLDSIVIVPSGGGSERS